MVRRTLGLALASIALGCGGGGGGNNPDGGGNNVGPDGAVNGAHLFTHDMPWDRDVSGVTKASESDAIIAALDGAGGWGTGDFRTDISIEILHADASTPKVTLAPKDDAWSQAMFQDTDHTEFYVPDCDNVPFPVPPSGALEGETAYACTNDGDCHLLVIDDAAHTLYEMWRGDKQGNTFYAGCVAVWDLHKAYDQDLLRGKGCSSADAGGFPITAMLATADEVKAGEVKHALRFILPNARIRAGIYVPPGTHSTFPTSGGPNMPPYGVRLRLKASFDESKLETEGARVLARALKKYGMFLADGGSVPLTIANDRFTTAKWSEVGVNEQSLSMLAPTDFEVVEFGTPVDYFANTDCIRQP
ncbi:MAG: hypothetical protein K8W52_39450 [Deltaproteobacteria bacterium]|nr:hypothetical protein [Deltaproteobacteria bacterium]